MLDEMALLLYSRILATKPLRKWFYWFNSCD